MQAIETKWAGPGKIRATAARGAATYEVPDNLSDDQERHAWAARELSNKFAALDRKQYGTDSAGANWAQPFVSGCLPSGNYAHVFTR